MPQIWMGCTSESGTNWNQHESPWLDGTSSGSGPWGRGFKSRAPDQTPPVWTLR